MFVEAQLGQVLSVAVICSPLTLGHLIVAAAWA
jgi:hypothetical protein